MGIKVTPEILIDGRPVACTIDAVDSEPTAIRGIEIQWGRADYHDADGEPASATLSITCITGVWAERVRTGRAIGLPVVIQWSGIPTTPGGIKVGPVLMFSGRISSAKAHPLDLEAPTGERRWEIEITAADRTADGGNALAGPVQWPAEKMLDRAIKVRDLFTVAGADIDNVFFFPGYVDAPCAPLDVSDKSALDLMGDLYRSIGNDSWAYDPEGNAVRQVIRLSQPMSVHLGSFDDQIGAVTPVPSDIAVDDVTYPGIGLSGCRLTGDVELAADPSTSINRIECSWKDWSTGHKDTKTVRENIRPGDGRRVLSFESWFDNGLTIDPTLDNVWERVREEGARPRHPEITTLPTFDFPTESRARWLLQCWENTRPAFIAGDLAYDWLIGEEEAPAYAPIVAPIGGTTTFDPLKGWAVTMTVHWIHNQSPPDTPATWSSLIQKKRVTSTPAYPWWWALLDVPRPDPVEIGQRTPERDLTWGPPAPRAGYRFAESVTWGDLRHVPAEGAQIIDHLE